MEVSTMIYSSFQRSDCKYDNARFPFWTAHFFIWTTHFGWTARLNYTVLLTPDVGRFMPSPMPWTTCKLQLDVVTTVRGGAIWWTRTKAKGRHDVVCRLNCVIHVWAPWGRNTCHLGRYINPRTFTFLFVPICIEVDSFVRKTSCSKVW